MFWKLLLFSGLFHWRFWVWIGCCLLNWGFMFVWHWFVGWKFTRNWDFGGLCVVIIRWDKLFEGNWLKFWYWTFRFLHSLVVRPCILQNEQIFTLNTHILTKGSLQVKANKPHRSRREQWLYTTVISFWRSRKYFGFFFQCIRGRWIKL